MSQQGTALNDLLAERTWKEETFPIHGKSRSEWLAYNMTIRGRFSDDWTDRILKQDKDALAMRIGCGLDSRYMRIKASYAEWGDCLITVDSTTQPGIQVC